MARTATNEIHHYRDGEVVLYQRGDLWQARFKLPTGKWHRISTKKKQLKAAAEIACERYDEVKFRDKNNLSILTKRFDSVARAAEKDLQTRLDTGYGKKTYLHYIGAIKNYLIPFFGNHNVDSIDHKKLLAFDEWRKKKFGRTPKKSTINNHNAALSAVFAFALKNNWIHELRIPELKNTGTKTQRRASFSVDEYRKLYRFMRSWHMTGKKEVTRHIRELLRDYVLILANTGMRHGTETAGLKWKNIEEFEHNGVKYLRIWVNGKTGHRELVANHSVKRYLLRIQSRFSELAELDFEQLCRVDEKIFRVRNGSTVSDWHGAFEILLKDAGLLDDKHGNRRSLYSLRHTYATFALTRGLDIHLLAKQMGTSVAMIEQHYSHLIPSMSADRIVSSYK